jgi:uncharacterized LabA/DUF88 family protein
MASVAVFVDAGYLFAQGSVALTGANLARSQLKLDVMAVTTALKQLAREKSEGCRVLRIYWYDGAPSGRLSLDQSELAHTDDIKLRLGQINSVGQQKGVDSLIVTDLIELARNRAISDALLVSGDEDVRIAVQIAQSFGVRVHLLGMEAGKRSQSPLLLQEADTASLWPRGEVAKFLSTDAISKSNVPEAGEAGFGQKLDEIAESLAASLDTDQLRLFAEYRRKNSGIPPEYDGKLLAKGRALLERDLSNDEKKRMRARFVDKLQRRQPDLFN